MIAEDLSFLRERLLIIEVACERYGKNARTATIELKEKTCSKSGVELLDKISECLLHNDFDEV